MAMFNWKDVYSVKIIEIDHQHKKLVALINELHLQVKKGIANEVINKVLTELVNYTQYHFSYEEAMFTAHHYPDAKIHIRMHNDLIKQVQAYQKKVNSGDELSAVDLLNFMEKWLVEHIIGTDKQYSAFFNAKGIN